RLLCRWRGLQVNALQREHAGLGRQAAWRGKSADLTPRRQDPVAGDDQRHRILRHGLADIARGFRSGAEFLREGAVGRCVAPSDPSSRDVDALEEWVLLAEVELEPGKIRLLAVEIAPYSSDRLGHLRRGRAGLCASRPAHQNAFGRFGGFCRQLEARDARVVPGDAAKAAPGFENKIMVCCLAHRMALAFRSAMELVGRRREFNRVGNAALGDRRRLPSYASRQPWFSAHPLITEDPTGYGLP